MRMNEIIRKKRREKGMTQEQVAACLGVTAPAVNKWESGASLPERTSLQKGVKKRLLAGGRIGWATGTYVGAHPACLEGKVGMYEKMGYRDHGISQSSWGGEQWHEMSCRLHGV